MLFLFATVASAGDACLTEGDVRWCLQPEPAALSLAQRGEFRLRLVATNLGTEPVDLYEQPAGAFLLDGEPHHGLNLWFGNGTRSKSWGALPPGESVHDERAVGEALFDKAGTWTLGYRRGEATASLEVRVRP